MAARTLHSTQGQTLHQDPRATLHGSWDHYRFRWFLRPPHARGSCFVDSEQPALCARCLSCNLRVTIMISEVKIKLEIKPVV